MEALPNFTWISAEIRIRSSTGAWILFMSGAAVLLLIIAVVILRVGIQ